MSVNVSICEEQVKKILRKLAKVAQDGEAFIVEVHNDGTVHIKSLDYPNKRLKTRISVDCRALLVHTLKQSPTLE